MIAIAAIAVVGCGGVSPHGSHGRAETSVVAAQRTPLPSPKAVTWRARTVRGPDAAGGEALMTESQAIAAVGWQPGEQVGAQEMTYEQASSAYPDLAGEAFIDPTRLVWIVTLYFPAPVESSWAPPPGIGATTLPDFSSATIVIDAATGTEKDWCQGCSTIPASAATAGQAATWASEH